MSIPHLTSGPGTPFRELGSDKIEEVELEIVMQEKVLGAQLSNGLFELLERRKQLGKIKHSVVTSADCLKLISGARNSIKSPRPNYDDYNNAKQSHNSGWEKLSQAINDASLIYRLRTIYALDSLSSLIAVVILSIALIEVFGPDALVFGLIPLGVPLAGAIGASLRFLWAIGRVRI